MRILLATVGLLLTAAGASARPPTEATATYTAAARGGYLLPSGYLHTAGSQILDTTNSPVRIAAVNAAGFDDSANILDGLYAASYTAIMDSIKAAGFNTVRIPYNDGMLRGSVNQLRVNYSIETNSRLRGLSPIQVLDAVMTYCGQIGLKVIIDHHRNEGANGGNQRNGLWFDSGPGSNGTDGDGNIGTITDAVFQQNWVTLVTRYSAPQFGSTLIGIDLHNEPGSYNKFFGAVCYYTQSNWGGDCGSNSAARDIHAMYQRVGNAALAINPDLLIICEGTEASSTSFVGNLYVPEGDLTAVPTIPVILKVANRVVYSVHIYPAAINDVSPSGGAAAIARWNNEFGFLYTGTYKAPVWIGEMGASLTACAGGVPPDTCGPNASLGITDETHWANTLLSYMNGEQGSSGGPTFSGNQQPIGGGWWSAGNANKNSPDGIQSAWGAGNYRRLQQTFTDQMLFLNPPTGSAASDTTTFLPR